MKKIKVGHGVTVQHNVWVSFGRFEVDGLFRKDYPSASHAEAAKKKLEKVFKELGL